MDSECTNSPKSGWKRFALMEPPIFLLLLSNGMTSNVFTDLIVFQTCKEVETNKSSCDILHTNSSNDEVRELKEIVQRHASYIIMSKSLIESFIPAIFILFLGPWSDKYGRKPLIIAGYFAPMCKYIILSVLSNFDENPWMFLIASVPSALLGSGLSMATYCYISDTTEPDKRAWRLACLQTCLTTGLVIGTFIGPLIFQQISYTYLFIISAFLCAISLFYGLFLVPETVKNESNEKWGNPFDLSLVKELVLTCTKKRDGLNRGMLWSCLVVLSLFTIIIKGNSNISYLFANAKLGWDIVQYSIFSGISMVVSIIGTFGGLKIMKDYLGFTEVTEALIGCLSGFLATLLSSFTTKSWHMYVGVCLGVFAGIVLPTIRSLLSKSAPIDDIGKVFSLVTVVEIILPIGSAPLYSLIYSSYIFVYPSPVFLLTAVIFFQ